MAPHSIRRPPKVINANAGTDCSREGPEYPAHVQARTAADLKPGQIWMLVEHALKSGLHPVEHCRTLFDFEPGQYCRGIIDMAIQRGIATVDRLNPPHWWLQHAWIVVLGWDEWYRTKPVGKPASWWPEGT